MLIYTNSLRNRKGLLVVKKKGFSFALILLYPPKKLFWSDVSQMLSGQGVDLTSLLRSEGV